MQECSNSSLNTNCCGKIILPFGADSSIGITKTTVDFSFIKSATIYFSLSKLLEILANFSLNSSILYFSKALKQTILVSFNITSSKITLYLELKLFKSKFLYELLLSSLLKTIKKGLSLAFIFFNKPIS